MLPNAAIRDNAEFSAAVGELHRRRQEALRLYRPLETQLPCHLSTASELIIRGGNRAGKTVVAATEVASAATRIPITGPNGQPLPFQYRTDEPLTIWVIGYDEPHIARIYRKLFEPGLFRIIKDHETGQMRAWRPWDPADKAREPETKPAGPLVPPRLVDPKGWAWENKGEQVFSVARLTNGTSFYAFPSGGAAGQGDAVHIVWIDEDIKYPGHVSEWQARLSDFHGRLIWSVWPHTENNALRQMTKRAKEQEGRENPDIVEFILKFRDNPFIDAAEKKKRIEGWNAIDPIIAKSRDEGEYALDNVLVFPTFHSDVHCMPSAAPKQDRLETFLRDRKYQVPLDWTNYLILDPGAVHPVILFAAVPPPWDFGERVVIWDEVYVPRLEANELAKMARDRSAGRVFEDFIIDYRAGRQSQVVGKTMRKIYEEAFERVGLRSKRSDSSFTYGSDNVGARNMEVRSWLAPTWDGFPKVRFIRDTTPGTQGEFSLYKRRVSKEDNVKEEVVDENNHAMDCLGYLAMYNPQYVRGGGIDEPTSPTVKLWKNLEKTNEDQDSDTIFMGAGSARSSY